MHVLASILGFILAIGLLVAVHEWGHFWVARRLGVKVLRFSIGFGRPLKTWRRGETEYVIASLPLGGYVKMLDGREGPVEPDEVHRAFDRQSVGKRAAIVAAGPVANLVFAVIAYALMYMLGITGLAPILDAPAAGTPAAQAGLRGEAEVLAVNGHPVRTFDALRIAVLDAATGGQPIQLRVREQGGERMVELPGASYGLLKGTEDPLARLGLRPWEPRGNIIVRQVEEGAAAALAGLRVNDVVTGVGGMPVSRASELVEVIRQHPGERVELDILRDGQSLRVSMILGMRRFNSEMVGYAGAAFSVDISDETWARLRVVERLGVLEAVQAGLSRTWDMSVLTLRFMGKMLTGQASLETISGPLGIADVAGKSLVLGLSNFLAFLALVSLSLAILNLLPVPVLDGGHLLFYLIEALLGRPLSNEAQMFAQRIGMSLLLALMALALFNDLTRLFF
ncbi:MAG: RIP metalloprotease RseP [Gammaproteobacteria bacterium]|nr:RIP metalloprotease RseP [Gammaproteobacteria bacterium]